MSGTRAVAGVGLLSVVALCAATVAGCGGGDGGGGSAASSTSTGTSGEVAEGRRSELSVLGARVSVSAGAVSLDLRLHQPEGVDPPIARAATVTLPAGAAFHGDAQATCSIATARSGGVAACPKTSVIGSGQAIGVADTTRVKGDITILDGGPDTLLFATVVRRPAYVKSVVAAKLGESVGSHGPRVTFSFPRDFQEIGGVPVGVERLHLTLERNNAVSVGNCPPAGAPWRYTAKVAFVDETTVSDSGTVTCR